jgi:hypothetical protein
MNPTERDEAYHARKIIRANRTGATYKRLMRTATSRVLRLVEILPPLLSLHCIAQAETLAIETLNNEGTNQ